MEVFIECLVMVKVLGAPQVFGFVLLRGVVCVVFPTLYIYIKKKNLIIVFSCCIRLLDLGSEMQNDSSIMCSMPYAGQRLIFTATKCHHTSFLATVATTDVFVAQMQGTRMS